jgi:hypothetical protein
MGGTEKGGEVKGRGLSASPLPHPILIAAFPVLSLYVTNHDTVSFAEAARPVLAAMAAALILIALIWILLRDLRRASVIASLLLTAFYAAWAPLVKPGLAWLEIHSPHLNIYLGTAIYSLIVLALIGLIFRLMRDGAAWTRALNLYAFALVIMALGQLFSGMLQRPDAEPSRAIPAPRLPAGYLVAREERLPDIYFIILDAYARADVLREVFGHDNRPFLGRMAERGFAVAEKAHTQYPWTHVSLPACLNMNYLENYGIPVGVRETPQLRSLCHDSAVHRLLDELGYRITALRTGYAFTEPRPGGRYDAIHAIDHPWLDLSRFEVMALEATPLSRLLQLAGIRPGFHEWQRQLAFTLETIPRLASRGEGPPVFVQAHIVAPHRPFVLDAAGNFRKQPPGSVSFTGSGGLSDAAVRRYYAQQVQGLNRRIESMTDAILAQPGPEPVIAFVSDHGPNPGAGSYPGERFLSTLILLRLPEDAGTELPAGMNLVQLFPIIFQRAFGLEVPLPPASFNGRVSRKPATSSTASNRLMPTGTSQNRP